MMARQDPLAGGNGLWSAFMKISCSLMSSYLFTSKRTGYMQMGGRGTIAEGPYDPSPAPVCLRHAPHWDCHKSELAVSHKVPVVHRAGHGVVFQDPTEELIK